MDHLWLITQALAKGRFSGITKLRGSVLVNGEPAARGLVINPGDTVKTGKDSLVVFTHLKDAFIIRDNSEVGFSDPKGKGFMESLSVKYGKILSVFSRKKRKILTTTAVAGVGGTGIYVESEENLSYICTCYGFVEIEAAMYKGVSEKVRTKHHESPRYILGAGFKRAILEAPVINHTDSELIMLESLVGRKPPFVGSKGGIFGGY